MHNNFTLDTTPKPAKAFYTLAETAVSWAISEGAKSASDPRVAQYSELLLQAVKNGELRPGGREDHAASPTVSFAELKAWFGNHSPKSRPKFLAGK